MRVVEILQYTLRRGTGQDFHKIMVEQSAPLHRDAGMDIVSFGQSLHDEDCYYLIRAYDDIEHLNLSQDTFYHSDKWLKGPREAIVNRIETSVKSVITLNEEMIDGLRK